MADAIRYQVDRLESRLLLSTWTNAAGGDWNDPNNWDTHAVPASGDDVFINLAGTYTVTLSATTTTVNSLTLGDNASSSPTFIVQSSNLTLNNASTINSLGTLSLKTTTLNGAGTIANSGQILGRGTDTINNAVTTTATSTLRAQGNSTDGASNLIVASGFTNNGTIELTSVGASANATFAVTAGTLTNAAGANLTFTAGAGGQRTLGAVLNNQGTLNANSGASFAKGSAAHTNSGTINVNSGNLTIFQTGTTPSFTNTGTLNISNAASVLTISTGTFNQNAGSITGPGTFNLSNATASFAVSFSNATTALAVAGSTINGAGTITNAANRQLTLSNTIINAPLSNSGLLLSRGTSDAINGTLTTTAGSIIRVQGNSTFGGAMLTIANGFTNNDTIDLTSADNAQSATLSVVGGPLTNAAGATVSASAGTGGSRTLTARLLNSGTVSINAPLTINKSSAAHQNSGTIAVLGGSLTVTQSGTTPSFTNNGAITVASGQTLSVTGAPLTNGAQGVLKGGGAIAADISNTNGTVNPNKTGTGSLVYSEPFNYTAGSQLQNQGGWTEPGFSDPFSSDFNTPEIIQSASLSYPNLETSGRSVQTSGTYSFDQYLSPASIGGAGNTFWFSFLIRQDTTGGGGMLGNDYGGLVIGQLNSPASTLFIGKPGDNNLYSLQVTDGSQLASSAVSETVGSTALLVAKVQFANGADTVTLYVNPTVGATEASLTPAATLSAELFNISLLAISTGANAHWTVDELRVATTYNDVAPRATAQLTETGNYAQSSTATLAGDINGTTPGSLYDQLIVNGTVSLNGTLSVNPNFTSASQQTFTIIDNDGADAVTGTFTGLAEGAIFQAGGKTFRISYTGGTGNDVTLTYLPGLYISADQTTAEGNSGTHAVTYTVYMSDLGSGSVTVNYATSNATATAGSDYVAASGTLTFSGGVSTRTINVTVNSDTADENDETFNLALSSASGGTTITRGTAITTITDDDPPPTISISDVSVTEGNSGTINAGFTVSLSAVSGKAITVLATTSNGTAIAPGDYTALTNQLVTIPVGSSSVTLNVPIVGDTTDENDETFNVTLTAPTNATINDGLGIGTILDDDPLPTISINDASVVEGNSGTTSAVFNVSLSAASAKTITVLASTADGTATAPSDYTAISNLLVTFNPGQTSQTVTVLINGDTTAEANETYTVNLSSPSNATIAGSVGSGTIADDDTVLSATVASVVPDPHTTSLSSIDIAFSEPVTGFDIGDLALTRDGNAVSLSGASLGTSDNIHFTLSGLTNATTAMGIYLLTLRHTGTGIAGNPSGRPLATDATRSWEMNTVTGDSAAQFVRIIKNAVSGLSDVFINNVTATPNYSVNVANTGQLNFNLLGGDDTLLIDYTNGSPLPANGFSYDGGANDTPAGDMLQIIGASAADAFSFSETQITRTTRTTTYTNVETLSLNTGAYSTSADLGSVAVVAAGSGTTVNFNGTENLANLTVNSGAAVNFNAADHLTNVTINSGSITLAGSGDVASLTLGSASATATVNANQTIGTITVSGGSATFSGGDSITTLNLNGGSLTFNTAAAETIGTMTIVAGSASFNGGATITTLNLSGGAVTFATAAETIGTLAVTSGTASLNAPSGAVTSLTLSGGTANFNGAGGTVGTLAVSGGATANVNASQNIATLNLGAGTVNFAGSQTVGTITITSGGVANFGSVQTVTNLTIGDGGVANLPAGGNSVLVLSSMPTLSGSGLLDVHDNDVIVDYTPGNSPIGTWNGSAYDGLTGLIAQGCNGGTWDGVGGIKTSSAGSSMTTLAIGEAATVLGLTDGNTALFDGQTVDATAVLIKFTYAGDANLDGVVNGDDYFQIDSAFPQVLTGWSNGDFNYDGVINGDDYFLIDSTFPAQGAPL